jgi:hypothetical protein
VATLPILQSRTHTSRKHHEDRSEKLISVGQADAGSTRKIDRQGQEAFKVRAPFEILDGAAKTWNLPVTLLFCACSPQQTRMNPFEDGLRDP